MTLFVLVETVGCVGPVEYLEPHLERLRLGEPANAVTHGLMFAIEEDIRAGRLTPEEAAQLAERWRELAAENGHDFELAVARVARPAGEAPRRSYDLGGELLVSTDDVWISLTSLRVYACGLRLSAQLEPRPADPELANAATRRFLIRLTETDTSLRLTDDVGTVRAPVRYEAGLTQLSWDFDPVDPAARRLSIEVTGRAGPSLRQAGNISVDLV